MTAHRDIGAEHVEIDPETHPILSIHWPFVPPNWHPIGQVAAEIVGRIASRRAVDDEEPKDAAA